MVRLEPRLGDSPVAAALPKTIAQSHPADPQTEYAARREVHLVKAARLTRRESLLGNARVVVFLCAVVVLYFVIGARVLSPYWLAVPVLIFILLVVRHEGVRVQLLRCRRAIAYYENGLERLADRWAG